MLEVNNSFKQKMKRTGKTLDVLLEFGDTQVSRKLVKKTEISVNGELLSSIMRQITVEVEKYIAGNNILTVRQIHNMTVKEVHNTKVGLLASSEYKDDIRQATTVNVKLGVRVNDTDNFEYIDFGEFVVYDKEDIVESKSTKLYLFDHLIDTHIKYNDDPLNLNYSSGQITELVFLQAICTKFGFTLKTLDFANANNVITSDKYAGLDVTYRDILDEKASSFGGFIKIHNKDLYVTYPTETGEIIDENDLEKLTIGKKIGAFNTVVLARSPQEDNIIYPASMQEERVPIRIENNQSMDSNREDYIQGIYNKINGLEYYTFEFTSFGFGYFEFGDIVTLKDLEGRTYKTILFNIVEDVDSGIKGKNYTEETKFAETKYEYASSIEKRLNNTEIIVNKQEGKITLLAEATEENADDIASLELTAAGITQTVRQKVDEDEVVSVINQSSDKISLSSNRFEVNSLNDGIYEYNMYDALFALAVLRGWVSISDNLKDVFDSDGDGTFTIADVQRILNIVRGTTTNTKENHGTFIIDTSDPKKCVAISKDGEEVLSLGVGGINTELLTAGNVVVGDFSSYSTGYFTGVIINGTAGEIIIVKNDSVKAIIGPSTTHFYEDINMHYNNISHCNISGYMQVTNLYSNSSGTTGTVSLNDSVRKL